MRRDPFKGHRSPRNIVLLAVRGYCRFPLSYGDVRDLLAERGVEVGRANVLRRVLKFGPEIARRACNHRSWRGPDRRVDESRVRVGGKRRCLWRAVDHKGRFIDGRLTARRDAKAAKAFLKQAIPRVRLDRPVSIRTDKAPGCRRVVQDLNHLYDPHFDSITHIDRKWRNDRIESDHAALKRPPGTRRPFRSLRSAKVTLIAIETIRTIKNGHVENRRRGVRGEIDFVRTLFKAAA